MDAVSEHASELFVLDPKILGALGEEDPRFAMALWWTFWRSLSQKLRSTNERLTKFFSEAGKPLPSIHAPLREPTGSFRLQLAQKQDLFSEQKLSRMEIHFLASLSRERRLRPGEVLFREGDAGDAMYVVVEGRVRIGKHIPGAGEEALAFMERGDWFGEMALIDNQPRSAEATAHDERRGGARHPERRRRRPARHPQGLLAAVAAHPLPAGGQAAARDRRQARRLVHPLRRLVGRGS